MGCCLFVARVLLTAIAHSQGKFLCLSFGYLWELVWIWVFPGGIRGKEPPANAGDIRDLVLIPELERCPGLKNGNPLQYFCLKNPWTEELGELQSIGSQRVWRDWSNLELYLEGVVSFVPFYGNLFCIHGFVQYCQGYLLVVLAYLVDKIFKRNLKSSPLIKSWPDWKLTFRIR